MSLVPILPPLAPRLPHLARLESLSLRGMKLGLAAIDALCQRLGRPERRVPSILIAGTNGKGSTAATLSAIAHACGLRVGLYTSPHLIRVTERVRVKEADVSEAELDEALQRVFAAADGPPLISATYFEALTAAAFLLFAQRGLDLALLEVGLGGRFDATNVAPAQLSLVTSIGLDHVEELGFTLEAIAREKAGIFRYGKPALVSADSPEALGTLRLAGESAGVLWHEGELELQLSDVMSSLRGTKFLVRTPSRRLTLETPLPGRHQAWNTALAVRAAELVSERFPGLTDAALQRGVAAVRWPGRLELVSVGGRPVLLDGCHNSEGTAALAAFLDDVGLAGRCPLVFGAMADKPIEQMAALLFPRASCVILVTAPSPRAAPAEELARRVASFSASVHAAESLESMLEELLAQDSAEPIIIAGSLYLVGQARGFLLEGRLERGRS